MSMAFYDAFNKQNDRIDKKRKDNREAFEAYRTMKAELGEDVTAEELQRFRNSLAGGDAFFLRDLGPGALVEKMAESTNRMALRTRQKEQADRVQEVKKTTDFFDTYVGNNLDKDPTNLDALKTEFTKLFPDTPDLAEEIWSQHSGRFAETQISKRNDSIADYIDKRLEGVYSVEDAEDIMNSDSLPAWKKNGVRQSIENRYNEKQIEFKSEAVKTAENYTYEHLLEIDDAGLQGIADRIMLNSKIDPKSEDYNITRSQVLDALKTKREATASADQKQRQLEFDKAITDPKNRFYRTIMGAGYSNEDLLEAFNELRRRYRLSTVDDVNDPIFQRYKESMESEAVLVHEKRHNEKVVELTTKADAAVEAAKGSWSQIDNIPALSREDSVIRQSLMLLMNRGLLINGDPSSILVALQQSGFDLSEDVDANQPGRVIEVANQLANSDLFVTQVELKNSVLNSNPYLEPGTTFDSFAQEELAQIEQDFMASIVAEVHSKLPPNATAEEIQAAYDKIMDALPDTVDHIAGFARQNSGAFNSEIGEFQTQLENLKAQLRAKVESMLQDPEIMRGKNTDSLMSNFAINPATRGRNFIAGQSVLDLDPPLLDSDGEQVEPGMIYRIEDGKFIKDSASVGVGTGLPVPSFGGGTTPAARRLRLGASIRPLTQALSQRQPGAPVLGIAPNPSLAPGLSGPQAETASIIIQIARIYAQDPSVAFDPMLARVMANPQALAQLVGYGRMAPSLPNQ